MSDELSFYRQFIGTDILALAWFLSLVLIDWPLDGNLKSILYVGPVLLSAWPFWKLRHLLFSGTPRWALWMIALQCALVLGAVAVLIVFDIRWPLYAVFLLLMANLTVLKVVTEIQQTKQS